MKFKIKMLFMVMLLILPMMLVSCDKESDPESAQWFNGKKFSALYTDANHDYFWYVLEFKYKPDGKTNDGTFTITPYDVKGNKIGSYKSYKGVWSVDFNNERISIVYDGYSTNYRWSYVDYEGDSWPNYKPNRNIFGPTSSSSGDPFASITFYAGEAWKAPGYDM